MITLYHGSYLSISSPFVKIGRKKVDFGQGFYLTKLREQAESWAKAIAERKGRNTKPILSVYEFDIDKLNNSHFRYKKFEEYNIEWLDYVVDCRKGGSQQLAFDIVEGGIANDNVIDTVEDYENGVITAEQALGQLNTRVSTIKYVFLTKKLLTYFYITNVLKN